MSRVNSLIIDFFKVINSSYTLSLFLILKKTNYIKQKRRKEGRKEATSVEPRTLTIHRKSMQVTEARQVVQETDNRNLKP